MRKIVLFIILSLTISTIISCDNDDEYTNTEDAGTLSQQMFTRAAESSNKPSDDEYDQLEPLHDSVPYPFAITLSSLNEGIYKNSFVATVYVIFYHDAVTHEPCVSLVDYRAPQFYEVENVGISERYATGLYTLSASGKDCVGVQCSGTYEYPLCLAYVPTDSVKQENDSVK